MKKSHKEILKYGLVGVSGMVLEWIFFFIFRDALGINYLLSHIMGSALAILNNFILNSYFTFKTTDRILKRAASYFGVAAIGLVISSILLPIGVKVVDACFSDVIHYFSSRNYDKAVQNVAKVGATFIVVALQFFANKYFTFKKQNQKS